MPRALLLPSDSSSAVMTPSCQTKARGLSRGRDEVRSDDLSTIVDRPSDAERERAAKCAQVLHDAAFPQEGMRVTSGCLTLADNLPAVVEGRA